MENGATSVVSCGQTTSFNFSLWCISKTTIATNHFASKWGVRINESITRILNIQLKMLKEASKANLARRIHLVCIIY